MAISGKKGHQKGHIPIRPLWSYRTENLDFTGRFRPVRSFTFLVMLIRRRLRRGERRRAAVVLRGDLRRRRDCAARPPRHQFHGDARERRTVRVVHDHARGVRGLRARGRHRASDRGRGCAATTSRNGATAAASTTAAGGEASEQRKNGKGGEALLLHHDAISPGPVRTPFE